MSSPTLPDAAAAAPTLAGTSAELLVALQPDGVALPDGGRRSYSDRWIRGIEEAGHRVRLVDVFRSDILEQLEGCDALMWRFSIYPDDLAVMRRLLPVVEQYRGIPVYPSWRTVWHYDDKIAQALLFEALGIPTPATRIFWRREEAEEFAAGAVYPLVLKLAGGAGSVNVRLVASAEEAHQWIRLLFGPGVYSLRPARLRGLRALRRRLRPALSWLLEARLPDPGEFWKLEKNYVLFQEFLPGNEFDTRVVVIGNRAFAYRRFNRPGDFRASGSGRVDFDPSAIDLGFVRLGFRIAERLRLDSVAIDGLYAHGRPVVGEISYTFMPTNSGRCPGHWVLQGDPETGTLSWRDGATFPQDAILEDFLSRVSARRSAALPA